MADDRYDSVESEYTPKKNLFREKEKFYRPKTQSTARVGGNRPRKGQNDLELSNVIDFANIENNSEYNKTLIKQIDMSEYGTPVQSRYFAPIQKAYTVASVPGLIIIPGALSCEWQRYWIARAMKDFPVGSPTNVSNLKRVNKRNERREQARAQRQQQQQQQQQNRSENSSNSNQNNGDDDDDENEFLWREWQYDYMTELRWATLGYHFQWTPRKYMDQFRGHFPKDLWELSRDFALQFGYNMIPEAATINYYPHARQMMGGHLDNAEDAMHIPIVSTSFGNTVIFLIGGRTVDVEPTALFMRSGDVMLMSGESRYCFHGVPCMLPDTAPQYLLGEDTSLPENIDSEIRSNSDVVYCGDCRRYIKSARINMNTRQVRLDPQSRTGDDDGQ